MIDPKEAAKFEELTRAAALAAVELAEDRKAEDVALYDVSKCSILADYYMICTGFSEPHLKAISKNIEKLMKEKFNLSARKIDGANESKWILMDFPNITIHIFHPESRDKYRLEELWTQGEKLYPSDDQS